MLRDRSELVPGDRISRFIDRLTEGDHVVCVISDQYLRSPYCMREIFGLFLRCRKDGDRLAEVVVPIVLPEVRISTFPQRKPYLKYWADQNREYQQALADPDITVSSASAREADYVREFAENVDDILVFIKDVLMPRNLPSHFGDGFAAVRDALWRRIGGKPVS